MYAVLNIYKVLQSFPSNLQKFIISSHACKKCHMESKGKINCSKFDLKTSMQEI